MDTSDVVVYLFAGVIAAIIGGALIMSRDFFPYSRVVIIGFAALSCVVFTLLFHYFKKTKKPNLYLPFTTISAKPTKREAIWQAVLIAVATFDLGAAFGLPIFTWEIVTVNGTVEPLLTIWDLFMALLFMAGIWLTYRLVCAYLNRDEETE